MLIRVFGFYFIFISLLYVTPHSFAQQPSLKETEELDLGHALIERGMYDMAVGTYQKFIEDYPQSARLTEAYFALGEARFLAKSYPEAAEAFRLVKEKFPESPQANLATLRLGQIFYQTEKWDDALAQLSAFKMEGGESGFIQAAYYYFAKTYLKKNDLPQAKTYFQKAIDTNSLDYFAFACLELGDINFQEGQFEVAQSLYGKASEATTDEEIKKQLLYKQGESLFQLKNYQQSLETFKKILDSSPKDSLAPDALANVLSCHFNLDQWDALMSDFSKYSATVQESASFLNVYQIVALALTRQQKWDEALIYLDKAFGLSGISQADKELIVLEKAEILMQSKKFSDGLALLEGFYKDNVSEQKDRAAFMKAESLYQLGEFQKAFDQYNTVLQSFAQSPFALDALLGAAHSQYGLGNFQQAHDWALEYFTKATDQKRKAEALHLAFQMAVKTGDSAKAIEHAENYLANYPQEKYFEDVLIRLAGLYQKNNQHDKATEKLKGFLGSHPQSVRLPEAYFLLGYGLQSSGKTDEALEYYAKVPQDLGPGKPYYSALVNSAVIALSKNDEERASVFLDKVISEFEKNSLELSNYLWLAQRYFAQKKFDDVLRVAQKAENNLGESSRMPLAYFKAEAHREKGNTEEALAQYVLVLSASEPGEYTGPARIGKGLTLMAKGEYAGARDEFEKAVTENNDDPTLSLRGRYELGNLELSQNNLQDAVKFFMLVATLYEDPQYCPMALSKAAEIFEKLNNPKEALKVYQELAERYPQHPQVAAAQERIKVLSGN